MQKMLNTEELNYISKLSESDLKKSVEALFEQKSSGVEGRFISENEFAAFDKWVVIGWNMPNVRRKSAYLKGGISKEENGSLIRIHVKPNSILPIFSITSTLLGIIVTLIALRNPTDDQFLFVLGLVFLAIGIIYYPLSIFFRNRLRNKIVEYLKLEKL